jgi:hypothetical protein
MNRNKAGGITAGFIFLVNWAAIRVKKRVKTRI